MDAQKKQLRATERNEWNRVMWMQEALLLDADRLVFVDESGCHTAMTPSYGWAKRGKRAHASAPRNRGRNTTLIAALSCAGVQAMATQEGGANNAAFEAWVEGVLCPTLQAGQVVVLDNGGIHRSRRTRALIEAQGCSLLFLPSYSPDFSPIEPMWGKLKGYLRRVQARSKNVLEEAITAGLAQITSQDAQGWFRHCGYQLSLQPLCN